MSTDLILPNPNPGDPPPFHRMADDAFEEMCCALLANEPNIESADLFGRPREPQFGIDIIGRRSDGDTEVISCKCYTVLRKGMLVQWSTDFLEHWDSRWKSENVDQFILATSADVKSSERQNEIDIEKARFAAIGVNYAIWPPRRLQEKLRSHPGLIAQFLGIEWVSKLCGISGFSWERPKDLLEERWAYCQAGEFNKAAEYAEKASRNAKVVNDKKTLANALRCTARDFGDHLISKHLEGTEADRITSRIASCIEELETLNFPEAELALEQALFARLDKRPDDARKYAEIAEANTDKPKTAADALLVQLQAYWQLGIPEDGLALKDRIQNVAVELKEGDAELAIRTTWLRTLCKVEKCDSADVDSFIELTRSMIAEARTTATKALVFVEQAASEFSRAKDFINTRSLLELVLELVTDQIDLSQAASVALQIAQIDAEFGHEFDARKHLGLAEKCIDTLRADADKRDSWASGKAVFLVTRSHIESVLARQLKGRDQKKYIDHSRRAYAIVLEALDFTTTNECELKGDIGPFIADIERLAGIAAASLGRNLDAAEHFRRVRTDQIMTDERFQQLAMDAWFGEAKSLLFGGKPARARAVWEQIAITPLANKRQRDRAQHNICWIDEHVLEVTDWFTSAAGIDLRNAVASEREGFRNTIMRQVEPLVEWFKEFPSKEGSGHAYSELIDIWGRGGFSRIVAAVRADPLNVICVDATSIDEIALMARVFCPLYDTVIVNWKGVIHPALGIVPMPDNLGPPGEFGGQGYVRTSDSLTDKDGWHAAVGWANFLPKEVSEFLATDALSLVRSGRLVLFPAPLIGCTQSDVGWTDNLFVDWLLGGVVKCTVESVGTVSDAESNSGSHLLDLGAVSIPFIDGVSL
ncbi:MAG: hypothetical protein MI861_18675, partial [Pirellulales bacterium]|nr:hypothetical protein [Pirellulales bacterium]